MDDPATQEHIRCLIAMSLSLQAGNAMRQFRESLRLVLSKRLRFRRRQPLRRNLVAHAALMDLCIPAHSKTNRLRRTVWLRLLTGQWDLENVVEHDCPGCCVDKDVCCEKLVSLLVAVMAACAPPVFPRHRWVGGVEAASWAVLLLASHGLLKVTYMVWASLQRGGRSLLSVVGIVLQDNKEGHDHGIAASDHPMLHDAFGGHDGGDRHEEAGSGHAGGEHDAQNVGQSQVNAHEARRLEMARRRQVAATWLTTSDPLGDLLVILVVLRPMDKALNSYLRVAGAIWEEQQAAIEAQGVASGMSRRTYRVCLVCEGKLLGPSLQDLNQLAASASAWDMLPLRFRSSRRRTRAALMISKAACCLSELLDECSGYPYKLFLILGDNCEEAIVDIMKDDWCLFDVWGEGFCHKASWERSRSRACQS